MTDIQAGLGLQQLKKLSAFHARRKAIAERYRAAFCEFDELQTPGECFDRQHAWHIYALRLNLDLLNITRDEFIIEMRRRNIGTSVHFIPVHLFTYYRNKYGYQANDFPVAYAEYQRLVSLPCSPRMTDEDVEDVIQAVSSIVQRNRRATLVPVLAAGGR